MDRPRGLTLVETVAVVGLISLALIFTLGMIPSFKLSNRRANMELHAGSIAQSKLEELRSLEIEDVVDAAPVPTPHEGVDYQLEVRVDPDGPDADLKRVRAVVNWVWKDQSYSAFRETLICRVPR